MSICVDMVYIYRYVYMVYMYACICIPSAGVGGYTYLHMYTHILYVYIYIFDMFLDLLNILMYVLHVNTANQGRSLGVTALSPRAFAKGFLQGRLKHYAPLTLDIHRCI